MRINYVIYLKLLFLCGAVANYVAPKSNIDNEIVGSDKRCDSYCLHILNPLLKPLLKNAADTKKELESFDNVIQSKDKLILELQKELVALQANVTIYQELETLYTERIDHKDSLITALEQKSCPDNKESLIDSLKAKIDENTAAVKLLKIQLSSLSDSVLVENFNAKQPETLKIQGLPINCVPYENSTGIHEIHVADVGQFAVLCDGQTAGNGWTVIQRRFDGSVDFYRNWSEYRKGFGDLEGEFFMGLEKLHRMTTSLPYELYIELTDFNNNVRHARYDSFNIGGEEEAYMLKSLGAYSGSAGDALHYNLHDRFTTYDRDNDGWRPGNCGNYYQSGGWFNFYGNSNLNGKYFHSEVLNEESIWWWSWKGYHALRSVKMMIRPKYSLI